MAYADELEAQKARSTLQLLFRAARLLNERAIARMQKRIKLPVRVAHTTLLPHIDLQGTRLTELARRLGVTKQAAGQLVDELEAMGLLERAPDPADARAKLVCFSARGKKALLEGLGTLQDMEAELETLLGGADAATLHRIAAALVRDEEARAAAG